MFTGAELVSIRTRAFARVKQCAMPAPISQAMFQSALELSPE